MSNPMIDTIKNGDCLELMKDLPDEVIDLTVTSPPYDNLRNYNGGVKQWSFEKFQKIAKELYRVTKKGGVVVWVVGDATINGSETGTSFKQALFFKEVGFNLHDTMIYEKANPIPQNHNRYEQCFEYMFVLSKGRPKSFNPLREATKNAGKAMDWGGRMELDDNQCRRHRDTDVRVCLSDKIRRNIFTYGIGGDSKFKGHPAVFPEKLASEHILSWSDEGDLVFDPFLGSGTTAKMALVHGRHYLGFELDEGYFDIARRRLAELRLLSLM